MCPKYIEFRINTYSFNESIVAVFHSFCFVEFNFYMSESQSDQNKTQFS